MTPYSAAKLEKYLSVMVGLPLTDMWRPLWMVFEFGELKPGVGRGDQPVMRADFSLMVTCDWRVLQGAVTVLGSGDLRLDRKPFYARKTPPRDPLAKARWKRAKEFIEKVEQGSLTVESVEVTESARLRIKLSQGYEICAMQCGSHNDDFFHWRDGAAKIVLDATTEEFTVRK